MDASVHLDLDGAWPADALPIPTLDLRRWGPRRYITRADEIEGFRRELPAPPSRYFLFGSGDFHHVSGALVHRTADASPRPIRVVCFDNHPDWDVRPPKWACGAWVNRALEHRRVERVSVWGCGNFEMDRPNRWFRNRNALADGRLAMIPWSERQSPGAAKLFPGVSRGNWQERFEQFAQEQAGSLLYVTVDMDCLREEDAVTDWEGGLFQAEEIAWAMEKLKQSATVIAGDVCGGSSPAVYARQVSAIRGVVGSPKAQADRSNAGQRDQCTLSETNMDALAG